jgi:MOB kinase activator 1
MLGGKSNSFRPTKNHAARALNISEYTKKSLGLGNIRQAVQLPDGEDKKEWLAANTVDFFNEISLLWGIITETGVPSKAPGEGFPPGFEYSWADGVKIKKPIQSSGPAYVEYVITWIEEMINDETLFPISNDVPFPKQFETVQKKIYSRMFRVFAIIYSNHLMSLESLGATAVSTVLCIYTTHSHDTICVAFEFVV